MKIRMTRIQWIAAAVGLAILPAVAAAQTPEERIDLAMTRAREAGIAVSLLESKIAEGRAKGVPMDRIAMAVESRLRGLERARDVMGRGASDVDASQLSVGADAIGAGVSEAALEKIASTGRDRRAVAVVALTQLVSQGIASEAALLRVQDALARGPQALANLAAQAGVARGRIPESAGPPRASPGMAGARGASGPPAPVPAPGQTNPPAVPPRGGPPGRGGL